MDLNIDRIIQARRTHKQFQPASLDKKQIEELLELIRWAPNHRLAQPWSCYVMDRCGIERLDAFFETHPDIASWPTPGKEHKLDKLRSHYMAKLAAIVHLTSQRDDDKLKDRENYAACAAAAQNLLLGAEARGYAGFWSSSAAMRHPETQRFLGVDLEQEHFVGSLWIGMPARLPEAPPRKAVSEFTTWIE